MAALNPDNYIKLFRLDDDDDNNSQHPRYDENVVIIPAIKSIFKSMFYSKYYDRGLENAGNYTSSTFPEDGVNPLIDFRHELEELFQDCGDILGLAAVLWEDISCRLLKRGFVVTAKQCSDIWEALYSEYLKTAHSDDEGIVSGSKHFASFECLYKLRSKYIDSKILEDITKYLHSRSNYPESTEDKNNTENIQVDDKMEISRPKSSRKIFSREEFSNLSNEEDSQMLIDAINAARNILEENIKESEDGEGIEQIKKHQRQEIDDSEYNFCCRSGEEEHKNEVQSWKGEKYRESSRKDHVSKAVDHPEEQRRMENDSSGNQGFLSSEYTDFCWDSDATQCFLDLRIYVETSKNIKLHVLRKYKSIVGFVSRKMLLNGYEVSEKECRKKWEQLLRSYNKEVKKLKKNKDRDENNRYKGLSKYFYQIDKVLRKSGLEMSGDDTRADFLWDEESIRRLICIRIPMENAFSMFRRYIILWEYIASQMRKHNFLPTYNECSIKWMELFDIYSVCSDFAERGARGDDIYWIFYQEMRLGFEQNARRTEAVINYEGSSELSVKTKDSETVESELEESSAPSASYSGSEIPVKANSDAPSSENKTNLQILETEGSSDCILEVAIHHCNLLQNIFQGAKSNLREINVADTISGSTNQFEVDSSTKIASLRDSPSIYVENNFTVDGERSATLCKSREFNGEKQINPQQSFGAFEEAEKISEGFVSNESGISVEKPANLTWTKNATMLMIKFKISRELKFRDPTILEIDLWKEIATDMQSKGHNVCHMACAARWYQLLTVYKINPSLENAKIIRPEYLEQLKLMELPFTRSSSKPRASRKRKNENGGKFQAGQLVWSDEAVKSLVEFKSSEGIRTLRNYGLPVATKMQAAGFLDITSSDVSRKWSHLYRTYRKALFRKDIGQEVKWQYFVLMDNFMKSSTSINESESQNERVPFVWTPKAVQKLIHLKFSLEDSLHGDDSKSLSLLWKAVADAMEVEGFRVTNSECSIEWHFLLGAYLKTKNELRRGNSAVIGKYFIVMDEALKKFNKSSNNSQEIDEPIVNKKRKLSEHTGIKNTDNFDQKCAMNIFEEIQSTNMAKKNDGSQKRKANDENVINLSLKKILPALSSKPVDSLNEIKEFAENNICGNSNTDLCCVPGFKEEEASSPILYTLLKKNHEGVSVSSNNYCTDEMPENSEQPHSRKEKMASAGVEARSKTLCKRTTSMGKSKDNMDSIISCNVKSRETIFWNEIAATNNPDSKSSPLKLRISVSQSSQEQNMLIQDRSVNSTRNIEGKTQAEEPEEEIGKKWSQESVDLLIDLKLQHDKKFPGWPRPEIGWNKVEDHLSIFGYDYTAEECRRKWNFLKTVYEEKISEIGAKKSVVQAWPDFQKINSIYKRPLPENISHNFRYILPKKRLHDYIEDENFPSPKKLTVDSNFEKLNITLQNFPC